MSCDVEKSDLVLRLDALALHIPLIQVQHDSARTLLQFRTTSGRKETEA
jgi:hypothetical protein